MRLGPQEPEVAWSDPQTTQLEPRGSNVQLWPHGLSDTVPTPLDCLALHLDCSTMDCIPQWVIEGHHAGTHDDFLLGLSERELMLEYVADVKKFVEAGGARGMFIICRCRRGCYRAVGVSTLLWLILRALGWTSTPPPRHLSSALESGAGCFGVPCEACRAGSAAKDYIVERMLQLLWDAA